MANETPDSKMPVLAAFALAVVGLIIGAAGGIGDGSILGGVVAGAGALAAAYGMWTGMQQKTQGTLGLSIIALLVSLGVAGLLLLLRVIALFR